MSLSKLIEGANDVLFRFYERTITDTRLSTEDYNRRRMLDYLGENAENQQNDMTVNESLRTVWENKSKETLNSYPGLSQDILRSLSILQGIGSIDSEETITTPPIFYKLLCFLLGSEEEVSMSRLLFNTLDDYVKINSAYTNISSGGMAEGVIIPCADYDLMTVLEHVTVGPDGCLVTEEGPLLVYSAENTYPGFVHLHILNSPFYGELCLHWGEKTRWGPLVSNKRFKEYFMLRYRDNDVILHGPCISTHSDNVDHLFCLRSMSWPDVASGWVRRARSREWPTSEVIANAVDEGILFAPIGSKFGGTVDCSYEWRISFSLPEKALIQSFRHTQLLCYKFYKFLKRDIIKPILGDKFLCSYFFKTTLFWMCEEGPASIWSPTNFLLGFREFQRRLLYWIKYEFCPHYFIPDNNLFEGLIDGQLKFKLEEMFQNLLPIVLTSLHYGQTFQKYSLGHFFKQTTINTGFYLKMKEILERFRFLRLIFRACTLRQIKGIINKCLFRLLQQKLSYFQKGLYLVSLCVANQMHAQLQPIDGPDNKRTYKVRKHILANLLVGRHADAANGWLVLSLYFYKTRNYDFAHQIAEFVLQKGTHENILPLDNFDYTLREIEQKVVNWNDKASLICHFHTLCIDFIYLIPEPAWSADELSLNIGYRSMEIPPIVFGHFLRFLCFHKQKSATERDRVIQDLVRYIRSGQFIEHPRARVCGYAVLAKMFLAMNDNKSADYWIEHVHRFHIESYGGLTET